MDGTRFDALATAIAAALPRRRLAAVASALFVGGARPEGSRAACKKAGRPCDKSKECCKGARCKKGKCACKGGYDACGGKCYKLDTDEKHCGSCTTRCGAGETCRGGACVGEGGCPAGADSCAGGPSVLCGGSPTCVCVQSTEGETRCGDGSTNDSVCGACESSADCVADFGAGAICVSADASVVACCRESVGNNTCMRPCPV